MTHSLVENEYVVWMHSNKVKHGCVLGELTGLDEIGELNRGISFEGRFPATVQYTLHRDFPDHLVLTDSLINSDGLIVGSSRLKKLLEESGLPAVEYHPVTIRDHKQKELSRDYFIVHPVDPIDCLNAEASGARISRVLKGVVAEVKQLVLKVEAIPKDRKLLRIANFRKPTLIRSDLASELDRSGFTGFRWLDPSAYPEV